MSDDVSAMPSAGDWAIFNRGDDGYLSYTARQIAKVTPKLFYLERGAYPSQINRDRAIAVLHDGHEYRVRKIVQTLDGVAGEYRRRCANAREECNRRIADAATARDQSVKRLIAEIDPTQLAHTNPEGV